MKLQPKTILAGVNIILGLAGLIVGAMQENYSKEELKQEVLEELRADMGDGGKSHDDE